MDKIGVGILLAMIIVYAVYSFVISYKEMNKPVRYLTLDEVKEMRKRSNNDRI